MALVIENPEVERIASEMAELTGESLAEAIRRALEERRERLSPQVAAGDRAARFERFLEQEVWPLVPERRRGRRTTREEEARLPGPDE